MKQTLSTAAAFCALCPVLVGQAVPNETAMGAAKPAHVSLYLQVPAVDFLGIVAAASINTEWSGGLGCRPRRGGTPHDDGGAAGAAR